MESVRFEIKTRIVDNMRYSIFRDVHTKVYYSTWFDLWHINLSDDFEQIRGIISLEM